ncbi:MAG: hypothetical protein ACI8SR_002286 [Oceanicoccus sp.]|jgi:uncharacterized protein with NRDE domain
MCLLSFSWQPNTATPLTLVANRDEFHQRPAAPAQFWPEHPHVLAGKDLTGNGTWLGVTKQGYFAALTNVRKLPSTYDGNISRGNLVLDYLIGQPDPLSYLTRIQQRAHDYDGFNLIVGNKEQCWYFSNRQPHDPIALSAGLYGLSNASLDTPWPKLTAAKDNLNMWLTQPNSQVDLLHTLLQDRNTYPQALQPDTGIGQPWETLLSSAFIVSDNYGTRASTGLIISENRIHFQEASYDPNGHVGHLETFDF